MRFPFLELELIQFIWNYRFAASNEPDDQWEVHTLTIKDAVEDDKGVYRIKCVNRVGTTEKDTSLAIVTEPPTFPTPLQVTALPELYLFDKINLSTRIYFSCF